MKCCVFIACLLSGTMATGDDNTEQTLNELAGRVKKMLALQTGVNDRTKELHRIIQTDLSKQPRDENHAVLRTLIASQKEVLDEVDRIIAMLKKDETAVVLLDVFQEVRKDMDRVHRRLKKGDVNPKTQEIEQDIADTLKEMLDALTKH